MTAIAAGQVWRSTRLRDYRVKLVRPAGVGEAGVWLVEPQGASAHGSYTVLEEKLRDPDLWELVRA